MKLIKQLLLLSGMILGVTGQTQTTVNFNYTGTIGTWTVPPCVTSITIDARGASGGNSTWSTTVNGGRGANMVGTFAVTPGQVLQILVGQQGESAAVGGGGGGTFVVDQASGQPLIVAGGGGGASSDQPGVNAVTTQNGTMDGLNIISGGTAGNGGMACAPPAQNNGGGGGGFLTNGQDANNGQPNFNGGFGGAAFMNGGTGGAAGRTDGACTQDANGGFGGGGGTSCNTVGGGGGGGYSGGAGGPHVGNCGAGIRAGGGGGGSFNSGSAQTNSILTTSGNGSVSITYTTSLPPATPGTIAGNASACENEIGLIYSISSVPLATSYTWTTPAGTVITSGQGTTSISVIAGSTSGQITVTADNSCGSSAPATFNLTINALPNITTSAAAGSICAGQSDTLFAFGGVSYVWNTGGTNATEIVTLTSSNTFTVTGTDNNGCTNTATVSVNVYALPTITATSSAGTICAGDADTLNAGGALTYAWSSGGNTNMEIVNPATTTTYTVTGTDVNGCSDNATVTVNVNQLPVVNLGNDVSSCATAVVLDAQNAGSMFMWSSGATAQTDTIATSGTYYVDVTDANGCSSSDTINVNINANPVIALGDDTTRCGGGVTLDAQIAGATYLWSDNSTAQTLTVTTSGTYFVTVTDANGCTGADTINVTINSIPTVTATASATTVCTDDANVTLTGTPAGGTWSGPGVTGNSFDPSVGIGAQTLTYSFTDANGCGDVAAVTINVNACTGINENNNALSVVVFPNPASEVVFVSSATTQAINVVVYDIAGKQINVPTQLVRDGVVEINVQGLTNGTYFVSVEIGTNRTTQSVIIAR